MRTGTKLASYGVALATVLAGGAALGSAVGPIDDGTASSGADHDVHTGPASASDTASAASDVPGDVGVPGGLAVAQGGYRLVVDSESPAPHAESELRFRIVDGPGAPLTRYEQEHERDLHLIVVGRNLVDYAHLHPTLDAAGEWSVGLPALAPGSYRVFADFRPAGGEALTLGVDLAVAGTVPPVDVPEPRSETDVDGYHVRVEGEPRAGESTLAFMVRRGDEPVRTDPYLGAAGHLVAIRDGDLAYLHVHPLDGDGDEIRFAAEFPSPGTYRLFLDFSHGGRVRTADFTVTVPDDSASTSATSASGPHDDGH
jgi:hypothetical protein